MRVAILRTMPGESFSMDVYADGLIAGLKAVRPNWEVIEIRPRSPNELGDGSLRGSLRKYYERYWHYPRAVCEQDADVFHIVDHSYGHVAYWLKKAGKLSVITCHDLINFLYPENLYARARYPWISILMWRFSVRGLRNAEYVIADSSNTAKDIVQLLNVDPEHVTVVPVAVDFSFHPLPREEVKSFRRRYRASPERICILHVGRSDPRKNISTILKVLRLLKAQGVSACLWKTGEDFTAEQKVLIQTYGLQGDVVYLGTLDRQALVQVYNAADVLLFPSLYEGFGIPVLESMACGTPVVTSNISSLPEVAGDAAILVDPSDERAIVEAILRLRNDVAYRHRLIEKGLNRAKSFTWESVASQVAVVYEKVMRERMA